MKNNFLETFSASPFVSRIQEFGFKRNLSGFKNKFG